MAATYQWQGEGDARVLRVTNTTTKASIDIPRKIAAGRVGTDKHGSRDVTECLIAKVAADANGAMDVLRRRLIDGPDTGSVIADLRAAEARWHAEREQMARELAELRAKR